MSEQPSFNSPGAEWDLPDQTPALLRHRAATAVWVAAAANLLLFGCCALAFGLAATVIPANEFREALAQASQGQDITEDQLDQVAAMQRLLLVPAVLVVVLLWLPSLLLLYLGFGTRAGRRGAMLLAIVVLGLQGGLVGVMLLYQLGVGVLTMQVVAVLVSLLMLGLPLALMVWAIARLLAARRQSSGAADAEPWNQHLG